MDYFDDFGDDEFYFPSYSPVEVQQRAAVQSRCNCLDPRCCFRTNDATEEFVDPMLEAMPDVWHEYAAKTTDIKEFEALVLQDLEVDTAENDLDRPSWMSLGGLATKAFSYLVKLLDNVGFPIPTTLRNAIAHRVLSTGLPGGGDESDFENLSEIELPLPGLRPEKIRKLTREVSNLEGCAKRICMHLHKNISDWRDKVNNHYAGIITESNKFKSKEKKTIVLLTLQREYLMRFLKDLELELCTEDPDALGEEVNVSRSISSETIKYRGPSTLDNILLILFCNDPGLVLRAKLDIASHEETRFQYSNDQIERTLLRILSLVAATGEEFLFFASGTLERAKHSSAGPRCLCGLGLPDLPAVTYHQGCKFRKWIEDIGLVSNGNRPLYARASFSWKNVLVQGLPTDSGLMKNRYTLTPRTPGPSTATSADQATFRPP